MNIFKYIGFMLFLIAFGIGFSGVGGFVQLVPTENPGHVYPEYEYSFIISIVAGIITAIVMMGIYRKIELTGIVFMVVGTFVLSMTTITVLNVMLDSSKPVTRTILVNNTDIKPATRKYPESYYALVQSWWDNTRYLPVSIPKNIYHQITPKSTYLDITVKGGAFGWPYFADVAISSEKGAQPGLIEFNE